MLRKPKEKNTFTVLHLLKLACKWTHAVQTHDVQGQLYVTNAVEALNPGLPEFLNTERDDR